MRVVLSPGAGALPGGRAVARALAGSADDQAVELSHAGVKNLHRRQSAAEVHALRKALLGLGPGEDLSPRDPADTMVGYVCVGRSIAAGGMPAAPAPGPTVIAVSDHANLTWESPLTGPNDDRLGPRFPVTAGLYAPEQVKAALGAESGVVAGVRDERRLSPFEAGVVAGGAFAAASSELAPVAVVAAHLGYRVAAAVLVPLDPAPEAPHAATSGPQTWAQDERGRPSGADDRKGR